MKNLSNPPLKVELVPKTAWYSNVRDMVSPSDWNTVKRLTSSTAGGRCEICNGVGPKWPVECHEVWHYDDAAGKQTLERTIALCPDCHAVKHIGFQMKKFPKRVPKLLSHMATVNNMTAHEVEQHIYDAFKVWTERSKREWETDISWLTEKLPNIKIIK